MTDVLAAIIIEVLPGQVAVRCPFGCRRPHLHAAEIGLRIPHCSDGPGRGTDDDPFPFYDVVDPDRLLEGELR